MVFLKGIFSGLGLFFCLFWMLGCDSNAPKGAPTPVDQSPVSRTPQTAMDFVNLAQSQSSPEKERLLLEAIRLYLSPDGNNIISDTALKSADRLLDSISLFGLSDELKARFYGFSVRQALFGNQEEIALLRLNQARFDQLDLPVPAQIEASFLRYDVWFANERFLSAAKELLFVKPLLSPQQLPDIHAKLWGTVMELDFTRLSYEAEQSLDPELSGWLSLGAIAKDYQGTVNEQFDRYLDWRERFGEHPAIQDVPPDIELLSALSRRQAARIGIMLPLSGNLAQVGQAIKDGFLAAYYAALSEGQVAPTLTFYDTQQSETLLSIYEQAQSDQVELMIGPLDKEKVRELERLSALPIVTLALNYGDVGARLPEGLYEFGLAIEDEAQQVAIRAIADAHDNAAILVADGSSGDRALQSFADTFEKLGGRIANIATFTDQTDYSAVLKAFLNLDASERRTGYIKDIVRQDVDVQLRRRQDIDVIFLFATPSQARSIKQTLNFLFAQSIPVYATSHIYSGTTNAQLDRDINNIRFVDIPWRLTDIDALKEPIERYRGNSAKILARLYAFGIDAFRIYSRLPQFELRPQAKLLGATGTLSLKENRQVLRELMWAQIKNGRAFPLPIVVSGSPLD